MPQPVMVLQPVILGEAFGKEVLTQSQSCACYPSDMDAGGCGIDDC